MKLATVSWPMPSADILLRWTQRSFAVVALIAIGVYLYAHRGGVAALFVSARLSNMAAAVAILALLHVLVATGFHWAHLGLDVRRPYREALASYFARLPARYLPGGIWHTAARYVDIRAQHAISKRVLASMVLAEMGIVAMTGLVIAGVSGRMWLDDGSMVSFFSSMLLIGGIVMGALLVAYARWMQVRLRPLRIVFSASLLGLNWVGLGMAFAIYGRGLGSGDLAGCTVGVLSSAYDFAASVGYVAIFAPQGWGVSELVFGGLHACGSPLVTSVAALTGFRLVGFVADLVAYAVALVSRALCASLNREPIKHGQFP